MTPQPRPAGALTKPATRTSEASGSRPIPIVALDFPRADIALSMVERLGDACRFYKVGGELFTAAGPQIVQTLRALGNDVFLDLKLHDIPNTVRGAARSAASIGAKLLTVHTSGGREMIEAAVEGAGDRCGVLGVTILTSLDAAQLRSAWGRKTLEVYGEVLRLRATARRWVLTEWFAAVWRRRRSAPSTAKSSSCSFQESGRQGAGSTTRSEPLPPPKPRKRGRATSSLDGLSRRPKIRLWSSRQ